MFFQDLSEYFPAGDGGGPFEAARERAQAELSGVGPRASLPGAGVGVLGEKLVHLTLKYYIEPLEICHEIPVGGFVADIKNAGGVVEIQTGGLSSMRRKLCLFMDLCPVTVVYPAVMRKYISWIDPGTGECSKPRKAPKESGASDALKELYGLRDMLGSGGGRLTVRVMFLDAVEYRTPSKNGGHGRGSRRAERFPLRLRGEVTLKGPRDYRALTPEGLTENFTIAEYAKAAGISKFAASLCAGTLTAAGAIARTGKKGRAFAYSILGQAVL